MTDYLRGAILYNETQIELASELESDPPTHETTERESERFARLRTSLLASPVYKALGISRKPPQMHRVVNTIVVGERGTGKSTWIRRCSGLPFDRRYRMTTTPQPALLEYNSESDAGKCVFSLRDFGGDLPKINPTLLEHAHVALIFYEIGSLITYKNIPTWIRLVKAISPDCYIIVCANMEDKLRRANVSYRLPPPKECFSRFYELDGAKYVQRVMSGRTLYNHDFAFRDAFGYCSRTGLLRSDGNFRLHL